MKINKVMGQVREAARPACVALARCLPNRALLFIKGNVPITQRLDYSKHPIFLYTDSNAETGRLNSCQREPGTVKWIETHFKPGEVFYDIGANTGSYSLIAAAYHQGTVRIVAIEPHPQNYVALCKNIMLNNNDSVITPLPVALSNKSGIDTFNYSSEAGGTSRHSLGEAVDSKGRPFQAQGSHGLLAFSLDDMIRTQNLPMPSHIKLDVDGIEDRILTGASETLRNSELKTLVVELEKGEEDTWSVIRFLEERGFALHSLLEGRNHLFIRQ